MKVFISHSEQDKNIAICLASFFESINHSIDVFCTSEKGSIKSGSDFVKTITKELKDCNVFIPLLSNNYYRSRFCMVELGFAYSYLSDRSDESEDDYIYPLAVLPIKKAEALKNTPLDRLQVSYINDVEEMKNYVDAICKNRGITCGSGMNKKLHSFIRSINGLIFSDFDIMGSAKILLCKAGNVSGEDQDYLNCSIDGSGNGYIINFKAKPFENSTIYADFLSVVFQYVDKINLYDMVNTYESTKLRFEIYNYTNSISKINIEIKYSNNNNILDRQTVALGSGVNSIVIPFKGMKREALKQISEICFVIKPSFYIEDEGMFQIGNLEMIY